MRRTIRRKQASLRPPPDDAARSPHYRTTRRPWKSRRWADDVPCNTSSAHRQVRAGRRASAVPDPGLADTALGLDRTRLLLATALSLAALAALTALAALATLTALATWATRIITSVPAAFTAAWATTRSSG